MIQFVGFFFLTASVTLYVADRLLSMRRANRIAVLMDRVING